MKILITSSGACPEGDWALLGVTRDLDSLARSLQQIDLGADNNLLIDCRAMKEADISGLKLHNIWISA